MSHMIDELTRYNIYNFISIYSLMFVSIVTFVVGFRKKELVGVSILSSLLSGISFFYQAFYCGILIDNGVAILNETRLVIIFGLTSFVMFIINILLFIKNKVSR